METDHVGSTNEEILRTEIMPMEKTNVRRNADVDAWVNEMAALCRPDSIHWCDGSEKEKDSFLEKTIASGELEPLNPGKHPGCYLHRSHGNDVARSEELTFICTRREEDAGATNHWMSPDAAYEKLKVLYRDAMKGRTMYVVPFIMGIPGSEFSRVGVQLTDSIYVVLSMRIMTHMGDHAWTELKRSGSFTKCLHSKGDLDPKRRFICHFPEDNTIWSVGSNYGGNALLGKKCLALRIASWMGKQEGWLAEHMLILGLQDPSGKVTYMAGAFPSACGKTNLSMLVPPALFPGYKVWTVGDDIAWMRVGKGGRLWAVNPEAGFFGVAPGTSWRTNPNAMKTIERNTLFTNVALRSDRSVWWEGMDEEIPSEALDWQGKIWSPGSGTKAAHPNSRFTVSASQCPGLSPEWQNPEGVPISAILFGSRRARVAPLIYEAHDWQHGVFVGATMGSETTAAASGRVGVIRRDPMAMLPFCGYNMGSYFRHWLDIGKRLKNPPRIFHVNWFRTDEKGFFLWPGYGDNIRVLQWVADRCQGKGKAVETPVGCVPAPETLNLDGLGLSGDKLRKLLGIEAEDWQNELLQINELFTKMGDYLPSELREEKESLLNRMRKVS